MKGHYDIGLVGLSLFLATISAYGAIYLTGQAASACGRRRWIWLGASAFAMGTGVWSMHFVGMLAYHSPTSPVYAGDLTLVSLLIAILASALASYAGAASVLRPLPWITGGIVIGFGMIGMHYAGLAAVGMGAELRYDPLLAAASAAIAILVSLAALKIQFWLRQRDREHSLPLRIAAALIMGCGFAGIHYAGMAGVTVHMEPAARLPLTHGLNNSEIAQLVAIITCFVLGLTLLASRMLSNTAQTRPSAAPEINLGAVAAATLLAALFSQNITSSAFDTEVELLTKIVDMRQHTVLAYTYLMSETIDSHAWGAIAEHSAQSLRSLNEVAGPSSRMTSASHARLSGDIRKLRAALASATNLIDEQRSLEDAARVAGLKDEFEQILVRSHHIASDLRQIIKQQRSSLDWINSTMTLLISITIAIAMLISGRHRKVTRDRNRDLEKLVRERTTSLENSMLANSRYIAELGELHARNSLLNAALEKLQELELRRGEHDETSFYERILENALSTTDATYGAFATFDENGALTRFLHRGISAEEAGCIAAAPPGQGLLGVFYHSRKSLRVEDSRHDLRSTGFPSGHPPPCALLGAPILVEDKVWGVICLAEKKGGQKFNESDELVLNMHIHDVVRVVERDHLLRALKERNAALQEEKEQQKALIKSLKEAQGQLLQSDKLASIGQLAAGVAHEINNPVGYIQSNLYSLSRYIDELYSVIDAYEKVAATVDPESALQRALADKKAAVDIGFLRQDIVDLIRESREGSNRVKQIVQDLKDFSHADHTAWEWADIHKGLNSTLNIVHNEIKYKAEVVKAYGDLPLVECLPSQLNQVFMNMLVNAAHAIEEKGVISLTTCREGDCVWVEIADTGKGIDAAHLDKIFDPFFTTKPVGKGTGLGLSISYNIIKKHGGRIETRSAVGSGTAFKIWIPIKHEQAGEETAAKHQA